MFLSAHWLLYFTAQQLYTHIYMHYTVRIETYKTIWLCPVNTHTHARAAVSKTNILQNVEKWLIHLRNTNITRANANRALLCIGLCIFLRFVFFLIVVFFFARRFCFVYVDFSSISVYFNSFGCRFASVATFQPTELQSKTNLMQKCPLSPFRPELYSYIVIICCRRSPLVSLGNCSIVLRVEVIQRGLILNCSMHIVAKV